MMRWFILSKVLPILVLLIGSVPAAAQTSIPFRGSTSSTTTYLNVGDCFDYTEYTITGTCTSLGDFTGCGSQRVSYCGAPDIEGDLTVIAANGDQISIHYVGTQVGLFSYMCDMEATGGTGEFQDAGMSGTVLIPDYGIDHPFDTTFEGVIEFP
jgi:hypothetical protein